MKEGKHKTGGSAYSPDKGTRSLNLESTCEDGKESMFTCACQEE